MNNYKKIIVDTINRVYANGLTTTSGGNLSIRDNENNIFITPSGKDKGTLQYEDVCKVKPDGGIEGEYKPSIELPFHSLIYQLRSDINAVLHVHSPYLVSYSLLNSMPNIKVIPNIYNTVGKVGLSLYDIPGSIDLGRQIAKYISEGYNAVMMQNHGVVVVADTMAEAYKMLESLENCAKICLNATTLGAPINELSETKLNAYTNIENFTSVNAEEISDAEMVSREQIIAFSKRCYSHNLFSVNDGAISLKLDDTSFLITPYDYDRDALTADKIIKIKNGVAYGGKPHAMAKLHSAIYSNKTNVKSVFSAYPSNIMAYGITGVTIDSRTIPESYIMMRDLNRLPFGADISINSVVNALCDARPVALIENSCVITTGESIVKAFDRLEVCDVTAKNLLLAKTLGVANNISDHEIDKINIAFNLAK